MKKRNLYLFTDAFPYGSGEKTFVYPELISLSECFDITVLSSASKSLVESDESPTVLPPSVKLLLIDRGTKLRMVLRGIGYPFSKLCRDDVKDIISGRKNIFKRIIRSFKYYSSAKSVVSFCDKHGVFDDPDNSLYYTYWINDYTFAAALEKAKNRNIALISRTHGYDLFNEYDPSGRHPFQKWIADSCDKLIFVSDHSLNYFKETFGQQKTDNQFLVLPVGSPPSKKTKDITVKEQEFNLVSCSYVYPPKRVHLIAEALNALNDPRIHWTHFGGGEDFNQLKDYVTQNNVNATLVGQVPNSEIADYYTTHYLDAFITTSEHEGSAVSICEAMSYGIPIIGTHVGGIPEQINGNGILMSANPNYEEVASCIKSFFSLPSETIKSYRLRSQELWTMHFNQNNNIHKLKLLLEDINNVFE